MKTALLKKEGRKSKSIQDDLKEDQGRAAAQLEDNRPETKAESNLLNDSDVKSAGGKAEPVVEVLKEVVEEKAHGETDDAKSPEGKMSADSLTLLDEEKGKQK